MQAAPEHHHRARPLAGELRRIRLAYVAVNAAGFAVIGGLTAFDGPLLGTALGGPFTVGMALLLAQALLMLATAARFDHRCTDLETGRRR